jgi:UDP-glucose 4-epimerase
MAILVTGGAGFIGGHMVLGLLDRGIVPVVLDNMSNGVAWALRPNVPFYHGDVGDYELLSRIIKTHEVDAVVHFAGRLIISDSYDKPLEYYLQNTVKSRTLLQAVSDHGINKFIYSASAAAYGNPKVNPVPETAEAAPISAYGTSKWLVELMLADVAKASDLRYVALRYFNVAGADPGGRYGQSTTKSTLLVQIAVKNALGVGQGMEVFGSDYPTVDGTCVRDYIHVTDLIDAHLAALDYLNGGGENLLCNAGYGRGASVKQVIEMVKEVSGVDFPVRYGARREGDAIEVVAQADRIREHLQWRPRHDDLRTIVEHALAWERTLQNNYRFV